MHYTIADRNPLNTEEGKFRILCSRDSYRTTYKYINNVDGDTTLCTQYTKLKSPIVLDEWMPGEILSDTDALRVVHVNAIYKNYEHLVVLINKRTTFIKSLRQIHAIDPSGKNLKQFKVNDEIKQLIAKINDKWPTNIHKDKAVELVAMYENVLEPLAKRLEQKDIAKRVCLNSLDFDDIYFDGDKTVKFANQDTIGINDYIWDYACLLARKNDAQTYMGILHNNQMTPEIVEFYADKNAATRLVISLALVDMLDIVTGVALATSRVISNYYDVNVKINRLTRFIMQSYTTIDYFRYVYGVRND